MNRIQYKILCNGYYEVREGVKFSFRDIDLAYTKEEDGYIITHLDSGVKVSNVFKNKYDMKDFFKSNYKGLIKYHNSDKCKEFTEKLNFFVDKEEFEKMLLIFENYITVPALNFYNEPILATLGMLKFDLTKLDTYLYKSYRDYHLYSCKDFIKNTFGEEMVYIVDYLLKI